MKFIPASKIGHSRRKIKIRSNNFPDPYLTCERHYQTSTTVSSMKDQFQDNNNNQKGISFFLYFDSFPVKSWIL